MATKKTPQKKPAKGKSAAAADVVTTLEGATIPAAELAHIAPLLRPFAVRVDSLTRDPRNARAHGERDLAETEDCLRQFGQQECLQFEPDSRVVKIGNGRHLIAEERLKWTYVAAIPSNLSRAKLKRFAVRHNRSGELAGWDLDELERHFKEMEAEAAAAEEEFDAADLGFNPDEYDALLKDDWQSAHAFGSRAPKPAATSDDDQPGDETPPPNNAGGGNGSGSLSGPPAIIITCRDEPHQTELLDAIEHNDRSPAAAARLAELLAGVKTKPLVPLG